MRVHVPAVVVCVACGCARTPVAPVAPGAAEPPSCRVARAPRLALANVYAGEPVVRAREGGGFELVVVDQVEPCLTLGVATDGAPEGTVLGECPHAGPVGSVAASSALERYVARTEWSRDEPQIVLGVVEYDWPRATFGVAHEGLPRLAEHLFVPPPGGHGGGAADPALASFAADGFLLVWVEGDQVRAQPLWHEAQPAAAPLLLAPPDTTDVGPPSVAFDGGDGLVAFRARTPSGTHVFATSIRCAP